MKNLDAAQRNYDRQEPVDDRTDAQIEDDAHEAGLQRYKAQYEAALHARMNSAISNAIWASIAQKRKSQGE